MGQIVAQAIWDQLQPEMEDGWVQQEKYGSVLFSIATCEQFKVKDMNFQTCPKGIRVAMFQT